MKCLIGFAPHGHATFVSPVYKGSASDKQIVEESGLLDLLEEGDSLLADKGFQIQDLCASRGVRGNFLPFCQGFARCSQLM